MESLHAADIPKVLFERHGRAIHLYLRRLTGSEDVARDLAQEVFLRCVRSGPAYAGSAPEAAWLFRIARNIFLDHQRYAARHPTEPLPIEVSVGADQPRRAALQEALDALPALDRDAFLLCEIGGLSYDEIASVLQSTVPAVRSRIYRARLALRARLVRHWSTHA
jgi:RNA polymerase sigma-70 factor, ECF subfamily